MKKLITDTELRAMVGDAKQVVIPADSILTPSAQDMVKFMNISVVREAAPCQAAGGIGKEPSSEEIRRIVQKVLRTAAEADLPESAPYPRQRLNSETGTV